MTRVILVRHGHTEWNEGGDERYRGRAKLDLDALGITQAKATAAALAHMDIGAIYSSPLPRAMTTAHILGQPLGIKPMPEVGLIDIDYGDWQGLSDREAEASYPRLYSQWLEEPHLVVFPKGESLRHVRSRAMAAVEAQSERHPEQNIVLVSHKIVCKVLMCTFLGLELAHLWQVDQHTCAINRVELKRPNPVVSLVNDICHLETYDENR